MVVPGWLQADARLRHVHHRPASAGVAAEFPDWLEEPVREAMGRLGVAKPWAHQVEAAQTAFRGDHVALATGTASGKTVGYLMPIVAACVSGSLGREVAGVKHRLLPGSGHSALYLAPTKALAHDQLRSARELAIQGFRPSTLDGDSSDAERRFVRDSAHYVLSNPDMLHRSVLPNHARWSRLLGSLRYVVIDEAHRYRGVFGAQVAAVLRRLRRVAAHYGADPVFISASATAVDAAEHLSTLTGVASARLIDVDTSRRPALDFCLWQPNDDPHHEAADLMSRLVADGRQTLCFTTSRVQAELVALRAGRSLAQATEVASYRGGYLADDRRAIERRLQTGELRAVACTNALELGVDITGVDAVLSCGFPGTLAALWQQAGRAGRADRDALAILIAKPDPLDSYLCEHPELIFDAPVERIVLHPSNPAVLGPQLAAAAQELPLTTSDEHYFGPTTLALAERLETAGILRRRPAGWFWARPDRAVDRIDLRNLAGGSVDVVDEATGRVVGQVDPAAADRTVHEGAVYLHLGEQWRVAHYDQAAGTALASPSRESYFTQALGEFELVVRSDEKQRRLAGATVHVGAVELRSRVTGYLRRDTFTGKVWDSTPLDLPQRTLRTRATWWTVDAATLGRADIPETALAGSAHAAEHAAIGLLPAFAPCDRWDIGGLSTRCHPDTGELTVFVHDGQPGGAGFADRAYDACEAWLAATLVHVRSCPCEAGCPRCVVSPKCGNGNHPLDKDGAVRLLETVLSLTPVR
ncbi:MAG: DEAD/DEAH box helicase [Propionicimonas sp.]